ncbi:hypothetical protein [Winogradskyella aurantiaca]|uniref:hypothetical protein n=1 Tax=Winogradskyella aurantiaca TaxID=2219558 RepID=UPI000E1D0453|nr:hypothetical protein [Winogradskyella aurantiaca]
MKQLLLFFSLFALLTGCKSDKNQKSTVDTTDVKTIPERIAKAHGIDQWDLVSTIEFTFAVDRDTIKGSGRSWKWMPQTKTVSLVTPDELITYNTSGIDSTVMAADRAFINDKFWLLIPFQLVWDKGANISEPISAQAPISGTTMDQITITYPSQGGYTPGDAYDIYFDENYIIREWTFRRGNDPKPTLSTTFEDYEDFNGLKIATSHKRNGEGWNLKFRDVRVTLE